MISKQTVINRARTAVGDLQAVTFSPDDTDTWFDAVIERYSELHPVVRRGSFTLVSYQDLYQAPADLVEMGKVIQWGVLPAALGDFFQINPLVVAPQEFIDDPAAFETEVDRRLRLGDYAKPTLTIEWDVVNGYWAVRVNPMPLDDGRLVVFEYSAAHLPDSSGNYPSIPVKHQSQVLVKLLQAEMEMAMATELDKRGTVQEGDASINNEAAARNFRAHADQLRYEAEQTADAPVIVRG